MTNTNNSPLPPIAVSPDEAARLAGIGRTRLYAALSRGDLKSLKIGTRRLILVQSIHEWLAGHETLKGGE